MIITCPACATRHDLAVGVPARAIACTSCGREIALEARRAGEGFDPSGAAERLAQAALMVEAERRRRQLETRRKGVGWGIFTFISLLPLAAAGVMPELTVKLLPGAERYYRMAGIEVNRVGLDIREVVPARKRTDAAEMLAVTGQISNGTAAPRRIPAIRFALLDEGGKEVFSWFLPETVKTLKSGDQTGFLTRIADPPQTAQTLEIRFARAGEIGSNAAP